MELTMKRTLALTSLLLSAGLVSTTAQSAEFASADCVTGLNEIGHISVNNISGSPQDVERIVALKADEQGASWSTTGGYRPFSTSKHLPDKSHLFLVAFRFCKFFIFYKTI